MTIDWVTVGNPENAAQSSVNRAHGTTGGDGYGAVSYSYKIGKYEVTNDQYTVFLNAVDPGGSNPNGIYNSSMGTMFRGGISYNPGAANGAKYTVRSNMGNKPVFYVSWYDAARFTNWLHNGQGGGSTETGAYTLNNNTGLPTRNSGAQVWLPSENEWYKAAYYDPTKGVSGGYWLYATQSDTVPTVATANTTTGDVSNAAANVANYNYGAVWNNQTGHVTTVGSAGANNYYGTFDMGGNVWEWSDAVIDGTWRRLRGGSWESLNETSLRSAATSTMDPTMESDDYGFRVASLAEASVPEPSGMVLVMLLSTGLVCSRRR